jgi:curved DNA-binding protein CbpA
VAQPSISVRILALQYHPDRHPFADNSEKAALASHFSAMTTSYETLLTVLEGPTS